MILVFLSLSVCPPPSASVPTCAPALALALALALPDARVVSEERIVAHSPHALSRTRYICDVADDGAGEVVIVMPADPDPEPELT